MVAEEELKARKVVNSRERGFSPVCFETSPKVKKAKRCQFWRAGLPTLRVKEKFGRIFSPLSIIISAQQHHHWLAFDMESVWKQEKQLNPLNATG